MWLLWFWLVAIVTFYGAGAMWGPTGALLALVALVVWAYVTLATHDSTHD